MKGYRDNGGGAGGFGARNKTVYDDVFGGPPKFGATTLPPRLEDYTEIFQGFHASRGSSIPVLDLPPPLNDPDDVWLDLQSSKLDYSEVFGGFNGLDFAVSYEELFKSSKVLVDDSSDDAWTPTQSESHSDELDPYTSLETNQHMSTSDPIESFGEKLNTEPNSEAEKVISNGITDDSQIFDGCIELESQTLRKQLKKSFSQPLHISHLSVSDLSLKTQPSQLPPPSRPPPKKGDTAFSHSKLKTSKSYAFEKMTGGNRSPPYFDVEIDATSSAAADAAAMKDAVEQAQAKLRSAKELMDRKKESLQTRSKMRVENNIGDKKERVNVEFNGFEGEITERNQVKKNVPEQNDKNALESFEQKEDSKHVPEKEVCGVEENDEKQETLDGFYWEEENLKQPTLGKNACEDRGVEKTFLDKETEADETESYDNLIEIQLKDNDMEPVLQHNTGSPVYDKEEDYDIVLQEAFEKEHEKELKESKEEDYDIALQEAFEKEHEKELKDSKDEILNEEYDEGLAGANEKIETIPEENGKLPKNQEREESERSEEVVSESEYNESQRVNSTEEDESSTGEVSESSDVVDQEGNNVILQDIPIEKNEATPQTIFSESKNSINLNHNNGTTASKVGGGQNRESEKLQREREIENDRLRKLEEERERQIEREKDRMAIDRATLEARERAFSETRERACVERATAEFRQRALAEARERLEKACAEARERSLAEKTMEGRLRVEKATQEARERAERSVEDKFQRVGSFRYSQNASTYNGGESESPQRCKARLERHQRTADRAAKALAEKNMRDLLAQKEQTERNRLAESLDAEVKRWCSGKQGNLRALLSTLQYILGSESGWQPVPLTEVITTAAVKKAYRKATLCVHPDKLQQRGASIQQKYICEKVFDLLKEAWNKFNSEER